MDKEECCIVVGLKVRVVLMLRVRLEVFVC